MNDHTPGPWAVHHPRINRAIVAVDDDNYIRSYVAERVREHADALLVAAAPDLLAACHAVQLAEHLWGVDSRAFEEAFMEATQAVSKAIAKARGDGEGFV